ncbi:MAG: hypothetical protein HKM06_01480 [Spirochaetales bacterium]|nr:hypothetical protein [Spirochaetales bacterium]
MRQFALIIVLLGVFVMSSIGQPLGNKTIFGSHVYVLSDSSKDIQETIDRLYKTQEASEFGDKRFALLFLPGVYPHLNLKVGFYTQLAGLGRMPDQVVFDQGSTLEVTGDWNRHSCTSNFWRSAENFRLTNPAPFSAMWAVSQACPLRRVHIDGNLDLYEIGPNGRNEFASGGFLADSEIGGTIDSGSQQQWFSRNTRMKNWKSGSWNMVFVGSNVPLSSNWTENPPYTTTPYTVIKKTPLVREKPFLCVNDQGEFQVFAPGTRQDSVGPSWTNGPDKGTILPINRFYIAHPETDDAESINAQLAQGKDILLTPGIYSLKSPLHVSRSDTVILGLGLATLQPASGQAALIVDDVDGVSLSGLLIDAGQENSRVLLRMGQPGSVLSHASNPSLLSDVFFRVGGAGPARANVCLEINSKNVIVDDTWIWRADHGRGVGWETNPSQNGLIVNGDEVTIYGLAVEHFQEYQTIWNGNDGKLFFYQCELPYDPPSQAQWSSTWEGRKVDGWAAYKVGDQVLRHTAYGLGIYAVFIKTNGAHVNLDHAIEVPGQAKGIKIFHAMDLSIVGLGGIDHTINHLGRRAEPHDFENYPRVVSWPR